MVEVFKTNVCKIRESKMLIRQLCDYMSLCKINFDMDDCDRVLRVEGENISPEKIIDFLQSNGYRCQLLES